MNILLCTPTSTYVSSQVGGAQTSIRLIGEKLAEMGHKVVYISCSGDTNGEITWERINGVDVVLYPKRQKKGILRKCFGQPPRKFKNRDVETLIKNVIKKMNIEIVYLHYHIWMLERISAVKKELAFKLVVRMAGLVWYEASLLSDTDKKRYEVAFEDADSFNYNTPGLKELTYQKVREIGFNYSPPDEFVADIGGFTSTGPAPDISAHDPSTLKIVVATRFSNYQKRQDLLIEALKLIGDRANIQLTMIGSGPRKESLEKLVEEYGLSSKVEIIPFLPQDRLWHLLESFDLLCHPCEYEGLSKIIVESMMKGLPVLASDVLPLNDYIISEKTGYLVENTPQAWADKLLSLANEHQNLANVGLAGQQYATEHFDPNKGAAEYELHFKRILGSKS
mgnify:CR=1 FL=1